MLTNASCTLYRARKEGGYDRVFIPECFWMDARGSSITTGGVTLAASVTVYISEKHLPEMTAQRDMLVYGNCPFIFDNTSEDAISKSFRAFVDTYDVVTVTEVANKCYGSALRHGKVVAK